MASELTIDWSAIPSPQAVQRFAPKGYRVLMQTVGALSEPQPTVALIRRSCANATGLSPLPDPIMVGSLAEKAPPYGAAAQTKLATFVEQFSVDVSAIDSDLRADFVAEFGKRAESLLTMAYVADMAPRVMAALDRLFAQPAGGWPQAEYRQRTPKKIKDDFLRIVYSLNELDPVLSEAIRLRGASQHNCRLCKSVLSRPAMLAGADASIFDSVRSYEDSSFSPGTKAALAMVDAMIWQPSNIPEEVIHSIQANFRPEQAIEIVLDVMRNAVNKIAVALGLDGANVTEGFEIYEYFEDGHMEFGLTLTNGAD